MNKTLNKLFRNKEYILSFIIVFTWILVISVGVLHIKRLYEKSDEIKENQQILIETDEDFRRFNKQLQRYLDSKTIPSEN